MIYSVLGLVVIPMVMQVMQRLWSSPAMPSARAVFSMLPKVRVLWVMYRVLLSPVMPTVRVLPLMLRVRVLRLMLS